MVSASSAFVQEWTCAVQSEILNVEITFHIDCKEEDVNSGLDCGQKNNENHFVSTK